ncbi:Uncharacterised protein [Mycobacteroides abscessus subsp. abscessus]|nr:Uncharacterised protein [Mycobacteroides abscessus subsp. abscessus]
MSPMIVWDSGIRMPMPTPWTHRAKIRKAKLMLRPASAEPTMNRIRPAR